MTQRKRRILIAVILVAIAAAIGLHYYRLAKMMKARWGHMPPPAVQTTLVTGQAWYQQIQATGTLTAQQGALLKSETAGRVTKIYFHAGASVKVGAPLIDIDPGIVQGNLAAAQAEANLTSGDYQRAIALYHRGALSKQDLDTALANKQADQAKVAALQAQLAQNAIHAPFSGQLGLNLVNVGDYVSQGQALVNLQAVDPLRVDFSIPEKYADQVAVGDRVILTTDSTANQQFSGKVSAIDSAIDPDTRTLAVRALINNPQHLLLPGNFAQVTLFIGKPQTLSTVPQIALVYDTNANYVYVVTPENKVIKTTVTIGQQNNHQVAILSGLKIGEKIVTEGQLKIRDGEMVTVKK